MKAKTIKQTISKKISDWIESIEDEELKKLLYKNVIVTGGCITSMFLKEKVNDFDVYFRTKEAAFKAAHYYITMFKKNPPTKLSGGQVQSIGVYEENDRIKIMVKSAGIASEDGANDYEYFETLQESQDNTTQEYVDKVTGLEKVDDDGKLKYRPVFLSSNAITLSNKIQLIIRFYGEPSEIHENYDFVHCTNYWESWSGNLITTVEALECILARELKYVGSLYPLCSIIRTRKFINRGWTINAGQYLKMIMQLNELDLCDIKVLEDQLVGVDVAYFSEIIEKCKEKNPDKVESAYLIKILDKLF